LLLAHTYGFKTTLAKTNSGYVATFTVGYIAIQILTIHMEAQDSFKTMTAKCLDGPWDDSLLFLESTRQIRPSLGLLVLRLLCRALCFLPRFETDGRSGVRCDLFAGAA
jgi:hypothetical protein